MKKEEEGIVINVVRIIEEINQYKEKIYQNQDMRLSIIRSNETAVLLGEAIQAIKLNENIPVRDKNAIESYLRYFQSVNTIHADKIPIEQIFDILIQILREEHIPSDLKTLEMIKDEIVRRVAAWESNPGGSKANQISGTSRSSSENNKFMKYTAESVLTNSSYSSADIVATINIPGRGPVIIGELSHLAYSILAEKNAVRSLGANNIKGFTKGGRFITGTLVFAVFDHSIVYSLMGEYKAAGYPILMDELPLFNIEIVMSNEYGSKSKMTIYGVTTVREGLSMGVDDMYIQNAYDFFAIDIDPIETMGKELRGASTNDHRGYSPQKTQRFDLNN